MGWGLGRGEEREKEREKECTHAEERAREHLAPPFICFLPPGPALCKLGSARSAVLPEVLTPVLGPFFDFPLFYFHGLFPSLSFAAAAKSLQSCTTLCDPTDGSPPGFPSLGFSRQEHWSGLLFPSPMHESEK